MRSAGAVWVPLAVIAVALYPVRLGFYYLTYGWLGADAIWWSFPVSSVAGLALGWWFYHYSNWRKDAPPEDHAEVPETATEHLAPWPKLGAGRGGLLPLCPPALDRADNPLFLTAAFVPQVAEARIFGCRTLR